MDLPSLAMILPGQSPAREPIESADSAPARDRISLLYSPWRALLQRAMPAGRDHQGLGELLRANKDES